MTCGIKGETFQFFFVHLLEGSVVLDGSELLVFLSDVEEIGAVWGFGYLDCPLLKMFFDYLSCLLVLFLRKWKESSGKSGQCSGE
jgi:hypothetical protein